jgi:hypothetical protein
VIAEEVGIQSTVSSEISDDAIKASIEPIVINHNVTEVADVPENTRETISQVHVQANNTGSDEDQFDEMLKQELSVNTDTINSNQSQYLTEEIWNSGIEAMPDLKYNNTTNEQVDSPDLILPGDLMEGIFYFKLRKRKS